MAMSKAEREEARRLALEEALPAYTAFVQSLDPVQRQVLLKNNIIVNESGAPGIVSRRQPDGSTVYWTRVSLEAVRRLLALDITPDHRWTDWIFQQAGGGRDALAASKAMLDKNLHERAANLKKQGRTPEEIKASQAADEAIYRDYMMCADDDLLEKFKTVFGWSHDFPGYKPPGSSKGRYEDVESVMRLFNPVLRGIKRVNRIMASENQPLVSEDPASYANIAAVRETVLRVERAEASAYLRSDVRHAKWANATPDKPGFAELEPWRQKNTVYADDNLSLVVPLTHAAAVEYGSEMWGFSSKGAFDQRLASADPSSRSDPWSSLIYAPAAAGSIRNVVGILLFKVPLPQLVSLNAVGDAVTHSSDSVALICPVGASSVAEVRAVGSTAEVQPLQHLLDLIAAEPNRRVDSLDIPADQIDVVRQAVEWLAREAGEALGDGAADPEQYAQWVQGQDDPLSVYISGVVAEFVGRYLESGENVLQSDREHAQAQALYRIYNRASGEASRQLDASEPESAQAVSLGVVRGVISGLLNRAVSALRVTQTSARGSNVYASSEEAAEVSASIVAATEALIAWMHENSDKLGDLYRIQPPKSPTRKRGKRVKTADDVQDDAAEGGGNA